ncbi:ester cyclase [Streptomyces antimycoticus]|uniref:ester cyclase n=1 Tax=Streptomyces antimycoticus TaxID=68175 RepID=UPI003442D0B4
MLYFIEQVQNQGRVELVDQLFHPDFRNHTTEPTQGADRRGAYESMAMMRTAFSDFRVDVERCIGDGDLVFTYKIFRGRHTGDWFGIASTGKNFEMGVMDVVRYRDGLQFEHWAVADGLGFLRQTGLLKEL